MYWLPFFQAKTEMTPLFISTVLAYFNKTVKKEIALIRRSLARPARSPLCLSRSLWEVLKVYGCFGGSGEGSRGGSKCPFRNDSSCFPGCKSWGRVLTALACLFCSCYQALLVDTVRLGCSRSEPRSAVEPVYLLSDSVCLLKRQTY